jgi:hypothetical protein
MRKASEQTLEMLHFRASFELPGGVASVSERQGKEIFACS